jgi:NAD+ kinase
MIFQKIGYIADSTVQANQTVNLIKLAIGDRVFDIASSQRSMIQVDLVIVIGGDGFMLHTLHNYYKLNVPFFGINAGNIGFLMNEFHALNLLKDIEEAEVTTLYPLQMIATNDKNETYKALAFNEVSLLRQTNQAAKINIYIDNKLRMEQMIGDGIIVATSAGSTAYNFSAGGPIIPFDSNILAVTPLSPFRPRKWKGALISHKEEVAIEILEIKKRPVSVVADFHEFRDITKVIIKEERENSVRLLFNKDHTLTERLLKEQFAIW